jgi:hypothetical protein
MDDEDEDEDEEDGKSTQTRVRMVYSFIHFPLFVCKRSCIPKH